MLRSMPRGLCSAFLLFAALVAARPAAARSIRAYVFNLNPDHTYRVQLNGSDHTSSYSGGVGVVDASVDAALGDILAFIDDGSPDLQPPAPPLFTALGTGDPGCAAASWMPSGDPTVVGYVVSYGRAPGQYEGTVDVNAGSSAAVCLLDRGMYYFTVQCRNYAGMLSAYASERSVDIVTVSVLITQFDARVVGGGVQLTWRIEADENIQGYRVYRSGPQHGEQLVSGELLSPAENTYLDRGVHAGSRYTYAMAAVNDAGDETRSFPVDVAIPALTLALEQNVPNPFNPMTSIPFVLDATTRVVLRVYDVRGALVATLFDGTLAEGSHRIEWDGFNNAGRPVSSGTYLYSLVAGRRQLARKMLVVR